MTAPLAADLEVPASQVGHLQRAARALIDRHLVLASSADFALVRRFRAPLAAELERVLGAHLEVGPTCARLRRPVDGFDRHLRLRVEARGRSFDRRRLAYLCLTLAGLSRVSDVVTLTDLAATIRPWADETAMLGFDPTVQAHRRAFVDVLLWLGEQGVVGTIEATKEAWSSDPEAGEVLYRVDHDALSALTEPPPLLDEAPSAAALLAGAVADVSHRLATERRRQRIARLLVGQPALHYDDLEPDDAALARREAGKLAEDLAALTGRTLERRAEGLALVAAAGTFPRPSVHGVVGLALCTDLPDLAQRSGIEVAWPSSDDERRGLVERLDRVRPIAVPTGAEDPAPSFLAPTPPSLPAAPESEVDDLVARIVAENGHGLGEEHRRNPGAVSTAALDLLEAAGLVRRIPGLVVPLPAMARYRAATIARSRAAVPEPEPGEAPAQLFES